MEQDDVERYDNLILNPLCAKKNKDAIGIGRSNTPAFIRSPKWEECFAKVFLENLSESGERFSEYKNIKFHDTQGKDDSQNSLDLICSDNSCGVEVTQAISSRFREEEAAWNGPLADGKSNEIEHLWKNKATSLETIKNAINKKVNSYHKYRQRFPDVKQIDLFIYIVDARIFDGNFHTLSGIVMSENFGYPPNEDFGYGLRDLMDEINIPYRRIYFVFENAWYIYEAGKVEPCKMWKEHLEELNKKAKNMLKKNMSKSAQI